MAKVKRSIRRGGVEVKVKVWLEKDGKNLIGLGSAILLVRIQEMGSLMQAAESMNMSYRNAWGKIRDIEKSSGLELVRKTKDKGRRLQLTDTGREVAESFIKLMDDLVKEASARSGPILNTLNTPPEE